MKKVHEVSRISFENDRIHIEIDGTEHVFDLKEVSPRLLNSSVEQRQQYEISPSGYGVHWPLIDEDLSIDGLLGIVRSCPWQAREQSVGR